MSVHGVLQYPLLSWTIWGGGHRFVVGCQYTVPACEPALEDSALRILAAAAMSASLRMGMVMKRPSPEETAESADSREPTSETPPREPASDTSDAESMIWEWVSYTPAEGHTHTRTGGVDAQPKSHAPTPPFLTLAATVVRSERVQR